MIQAYKKFWKGYVDFSGVTSRKDYWLAVLASFAVTFVLSVLGSVIDVSGRGNSDAAINVLTSVYSLAVFLPSLAIMVRRLRDAGLGWTNIFWTFLPFAGAIILIVKLCRPSAESFNVHALPSEYTPGAPAHRTCEPKIAFCHNCGTPLEENVKFCPQCGAKRFSPADPGKADYRKTNTNSSVQVDEKASQATASGNNSDIQHYIQLADKYAHIESLFAENPEKKDIEAQLSTGGIDAQEGIAQFLTVCASGQMTHGWWNGAASLTKMIRKINKDTAESILLKLKNLKTNIWEYHTQVIDTAEKELLELKKENGGYSDGRIPAEFAHAELLNLQTLNPPEKRLETFFAMQDSVPSWSNADKALYYFIAGGAARVLYPINKSNLAFYAAQVSCDPSPNSMGWQHLRETEGASLPATIESAKQMCEKYPLPKTMDEAKNYIHGFEMKEEVSKTDTAAYTLDAGLSDLLVLFRAYPQLNRSEIQAVGQKIYDADIPLVSGVGGMHQLFAQFNERLPMYGAELSHIWDGIGDWAD